MPRLKSYFFLLALLLMGLPLHVYAQIWMEHEAIYEEADGYLQGEEFEEAIPLFQLLEKKGISNANVSYKLGLCYLGMDGRRKKSIPYLESAIQNTTNSYINKISEQNSPQEAFLKLGIAYRIANRFDDAIEAFEAYKSTLNSDKEKRGVDAYINQVENARFFKETEAQFVLNYINDNSNYSLSNPVVYTDSLLFYMEERPFYNAVVSGAIKDNVLVERTNLTPQIGTEEELELLSIADKGNMLILRAYIAEKGYELYYCLKGEDGYGEYKAFEAPINSPNNEMFASLSSTGNVLYFSSNRPGGKGGTDIYTSEKDENGNWGTPINMGSLVNTPYNEEVCYIAPGDSVLYISSQGHLNSGGYDLFYTFTNKEGAWNAPINFGYPVSTTDDDNFISTSIEDELYTSRFSDESGGQEGVFSISPLEKTLRKHILVHGTLNFDDVVKAKEVSYIISKSANNEILKRGVTNSEGEAKNFLVPDSYLIKYIYSEDIQASQKLVIKDDISTDELYLSPPEWVITESDVQVRTFTIDNILFDFNSIALQKRYYSMLDTLIGSLLAGEIEEIQLIGHSDAIGGDEYNKKLSLKRALAVAAYLKEKGVSDHKIIVLGAGEKAPVAKNSNSDGTDNSMGRRYNRRVEVVIEPNGIDFVIRKSETIPDDLLIP